MDICPFYRVILQAVNQGVSPSPPNGIGHSLFGIQHNRIRIEHCRSGGRAVLIQNMHGVDAGIGELARTACAGMNAALHELFLLPG